MKKLTVLFLICCLIFLASCSKVNYIVSETENDTLITSDGFSINNNEKACYEAYLAEYAQISDVYLTDLNSDNYPEIIFSGKNQLDDDPVISLNFVTYIKDSGLCRYTFDSGDMILTGKNMFISVGKVMTAGGEKLSRATVYEYNGYITPVDCLFSESDIGIFSDKLMKEYSVSALDEDVITISEAEKKLSIDVSSKSDELLDCLSSYPKQIESEYNLILSKCTVDDFDLDGEYEAVGTSMSWNSDEGCYYGKQYFCNKNGVKEIYSGYLGSGDHITKGNYGTYIQVPADNATSLSAVIYKLGNGEFKKLDRLSDKSAFCFNLRSDLFGDGFYSSVSQAYDYSFTDAQLVNGMGNTIKTYLYYDTPDAFMPVKSMETKDKSVIGTEFDSIALNNGLTFHSVIERNCGIISINYIKAVQESYDCKYINLISVDDKFYLCNSDYDKIISADNFSPDYLCGGKQLKSVLQ